jgi:hypothetical protein
VFTIYGGGFYADIWLEKSARFTALLTAWAAVADL